MRQLDLFGPSLVYVDRPTASKEAHAIPPDRTGSAVKRSKPQTDKPKRTADVICHPGWVRKRAQYAASETLTLPINEQSRHRNSKEVTFRLQLEMQHVSQADAHREAAKYAAIIECEMRRQIITSIILDERGGAA